MSQSGLNASAARGPAAKLGAGEATASFVGDDFDRDVWSVLGLPIDVATAPDAVQAIERAARDRMRLSFVTPNVNFLVRALRNPDARRELVNADLSLVDGAPLVAIGRLLGAPLKERCAGSDVFDALRRRPGFPGRRLRVFFFGGREGAAAAAAAAVELEQRGVESAGHLNPGSGDVASMSTDAVIEKINAADADFVLVALGAAKGQSWIDRNRGRLSAPIVAHLGAVVDFTAGTVRRAPGWVRRLNLEWAYRIGEEPALWRRYWDDAAALLGIVATRLPAALTAGGQATGVRAACAVERCGPTCRLALSGDLVAGALDEVRRAFRDAATSGDRITLDLSAAGRIDAAFLGLVLMLEKVLGEKNGAIAVAGASPMHRRLLKAHAAPYPLLSNDDATAAERPIAASL